MTDNKSKKETLYDISGQFLKKTQVHFNLNENVIVTTEDKVRLCLMKYLKNIEKRHSWINPLELLITVILTFIATDFKDLFFSKYTWQAIFYILGVIFLVWLIYGICNFFRAKTIDDVVGEIKKSSDKLRK